jgi:hydroxylamine oxidation protein HaoB
LTAPLTSNQRVPARWLDKLLPSLGILLVTGGFVLLAWFAWLWFTPGSAPYRYHLLETGEASKFPELELSAWPELTINQYELHVPETDQPVALAYFGQRGQLPPTLLNWENRTGEPLINLDRKPAELSALATAISKHAASDALILAWWDTSRQLALLTERDVLFRTPLHEPLIIPDDWQARATAIRAYESEQADTLVTAQEREQFQSFTQALLNPLETGIAQLRQLTGPTREAYLVVHVSDLYKLGLMYPDRIGVAYKNYRMTGNIHGMISHLKTEMGTRGYQTYTLQSLSDELIRAFFLTDQQSYGALLTRLLPFTDNPPPVELEEPQLIYQQGGYWVYKLPLAGTPGQPDLNAPPATTP